MRRRFWKRKQEPEAEDPPEDVSSETVHQLEGSSSAGTGSWRENYEIQPMNSEFRAMNSKVRPVNSEIRPTIPGAFGTDEYYYKHKRDLLGFFRVQAASQPVQTAPENVPLF
ncbi:hypothetical protein PIB30_107671 [Stylosanthes scabra]|uniref:Uncharacterized protein n=1 Tax=Stylosanthes scabra TaxID=79078 RepID=A0ABU6ZXS9_9FABA|nr:hypothetical protein [Stylosanthes scabra]